MVRKLASHKCGPLSIPGVDAVIMWVKFVIASLPCSERFFSGCSGFLPLLKNKPHGHVSTSSYVVRAPWINSLYVYKLRFYLCWEDCEHKSQLWGVALGAGHYVSPGGVGEDLRLNKVKFSRSPLECYFTEVILPNNI